MRAFTLTFSYHLVKQPIMKAIFHDITINSQDICERVLQGIRHHTRDYV